MPVPFTDALRDEYDALFASAGIRPERAAEVAVVARRLTLPANMTKY